MKKLLPPLCRALLLALPAAPAAAQTLAERVVVVSPVVGEVIDGAEKARFGLFPYYSADDFREARFVRALAPDSALTLRTRLRDGREVARPFTAAEFGAVAEAIARRQREVTAPGPAAAPPGAPARPAAGPGISAPEIVGRSYSVELRSGNTFVGVLRAAGFEELEFETKDLGPVRVQRADLKRLELLTEDQARRGFADVGNGTRMFFAPTARNLRRGEGYVQDIDVYLLGANYGITDNFSVGVLVPVLPFVAGKVFFVTPKVSVAVTEKFNVGVGVLYGRVYGFGSDVYGGGVGYGVGTYGTADNNVTLGLGYGFTDRGGTTSSPVVVLGGAKRVSNRFSVINETYIVQGGLASLSLAGLLGGRYHASRFSGSLGLLYGTSVGGIYPAYLEGAYRFGKHK